MNRTFYIMPGMLRLFIITTLLLLSVACATAGGKPGWLVNPKEIYPDTRFVTGLGEGDGIEAAASTATAALSAVLESKVDSVTKVNQKLVQNDLDSSFTSVTNVDVAVKSAQRIEGVQIKERWEDRSGRHFALAVLDRDEAARNLADRMRKHESGIRTKLGNAETAATPLERVKTLTPTAELALERDAWMAQYRVLSGSSWNAAPTSAKIETLIEQAIDEATFTIDARVLEEESGNMQSNRTFAKTIGDLVNESGFRVNPGNGGKLQATSLITLSEPFERGSNTWVHYMWDVSLEIAANEPGARAFLIVEDSGSTSNPAKSTAKRGAIQQAENAILRKFRDEFNGYLSKSD